MLAQEALEVRGGLDLLPPVAGTEMNQALPSTGPGTGSAPVRPLIRLRHDRAAR